MKIKVIINNYNYARYLHQCLDSVLQQSHPFDQVIIVDDGSTDESREIIAHYCSKHSTVFSILKSNGGQLSCFNAALEYVDENDIVFLLDADDVYAFNYVENMLPEMDGETDHAFSQRMTFIDGKEKSIKDAIINNISSILIPNSTYLTLRTNCFVGGPTSANVFTGYMFRKVLPYPFEKNWIISADSVLVRGASVLGARKKYVPALAIGYRSHGENITYGKKRSTEERQRIILNQEQCAKYLSNKYHIGGTSTLIKVFFELFNLSKSARSEYFIPGTLRVLFPKAYPRSKTIFRNFIRKLIHPMKRIAS